MLLCTHFYGKQDSTAVLDLDLGTQMIEYSAKKYLILNAHHITFQ